jgi:hypothetical protein
MPLPRWGEKNGNLFFKEHYRAEQLQLKTISKSIESGEFQ